MGKVTIKDVAKEAGVSISTVSNALNDVDVLSPETKDKVLDAAKRLKYIPNLNGKNLKAKKNRTIGLYMNSMDGPFYGVLVDAISKACESRDYELIIHITMNKERVLRSILGYNEDGVMLLYGDENDEIVELVKEYEIPSVFLEKKISDNKISSISFDSYQAGRLAARCLIGAGNKRLGYVHGVEGSFDDDERFRGFLDEIGSSDAEFDNTAELYGDFNDKLTYKNVTEYLKNTEDKVDAFFAANDSSAVGCINALINAGYTVPGDFSVVGCDGLEVGRMFNPALTTVENPIEKQGSIATDVLLDLVDGNRCGSVETLSVKLVYRSSVGAPDKKKL